MSDLVPDPLDAARRIGHTLVRVKTGDTVHVPTCPHLSWTTKTTDVTDPAEVARWRLCTACESELAGRGRTPYPDLERAMEALPVPLDNRPMVRQLFADHDAELIWIPHSGSYIGAGGPQVRTRYIGKGYVWIDGRTHWLPVSGESRGRASGGRTEPQEVLCPTCQMVLPATRICDTCS
ncbi:hypothetical protein [Puerhibacterium sp. TATVAM-FAB25]|uniref:hypothetical protein n=1 Tax=Puerhibacterium sp. TATVAM-FAB25 TaxID=3093699 RepID=UPI00397B88AD